MATEIADPFLLTAERNLRVQNEVLAALAQAMADAAAMRAEAETPAAGPDAAMTRGRRFAAGTGTIAPAEWKTCSPAPSGSFSSNSLR